MDINDKYQSILKKCRFISKPDTWFVEGSEAKLDGESFDKYKNGDKFNSGSGMFTGLTNETYNGFTGELPRMDGESCAFDEFLIYDEFGNEISELSYDELMPKMRVGKINEIQKYDKA